jgi:hypothetical protein
MIFKVNQDITSVSVGGHSFVVENGFLEIPEDLVNVFTNGHFIDVERVAEKIVDAVVEISPEKEDNTEIGKPVVISRKKGMKHERSVRA